MKWYQKTWGIVLLLLFFFPAGLYFLWKSEHSKNTKIAGTIATMILIILSIATKDQPRAVQPEPKQEIVQETKQEEPAQQEEKPQQAQQQQPARRNTMPDIGLTYSEFYAQFNDNAAKFDERFIWRMSEAKLQEGVQKVFTYKFSPKMIMQGAMYPGSERMKEIWIVSNAENDDERMILTRLYITLIRTLNQSISDGEITTILSGVTQRDGAEVVKYGIRYKMMVIPNTGLMFIASAKDL